MLPFEGGLSQRGCFGRVEDIRIDTWGAGVLDESALGESGGGRVGGQQEGAVEGGLAGATFCVELGFLARCKSVCETFVGAGGGVAGRTGRSGQGD